MKRSAIERQLKNDLEKSAPSDFSAVWAKCSAQAPEKVTEKVTVRERAAATSGGGNERSGFNARRILACAIAAILLLSLVLTGIWNGWFVDQKQGGSPFSGGTFVIDVNPSVEVTYDKNGKVTSAEGLNEDGKALLYGVELVGKDYKSAVNEVFDRCVKLGYFSSDREDNAALVSATNEKGEKDEKVTNAVKTAFAQKFDEKNIRGVVITGVVNPSMDSTAESYGVDTQKYALILSYLDLLGVPEEDRAEKIQALSGESVKSIYQKIEETQKAQKKAELEALEAELSAQEKALFETLAEKISRLLDNLEDAIENLYEDTLYEQRGEAFAEWVEELSDYAERLEDSKESGEAEKIVSEILASLDKMALRIVDGYVSKTPQGNDRAQNDDHRNGQHGEKPDAPTEGGGIESVALDAYLLGLIVNARLEIWNSFEAFDEVADSIAAKRLSAEEISDKRQEKFDKDDSEGEDFDYDEWQKSHEEEYSSDWYKIKKNWMKDRERDLDD